MASIVFRLSVKTRVSLSSMPRQGPSPWFTGKRRCWKKHRAARQFFQQRLLPVNQGDGPCLGMLDSETLVFTDSRKTMDAIQARAREKNGELPAGVRALLDSG